MRTGGVCRLRKGVSRTHAGAACSGPEDARRERSMTASEEKFTRQRLLEVQTLTPNLFTLRTSRDPGFRFTAGQFARLGVRKPSGCIVWRAYSMVSAPHDEFLDFFSIVVPDGEFTSELSRLAVGDELLVDKQAFGFLTQIGRAHV